MREMNRLQSKNEMRIALCKDCNFDCFFCHSEGLDRKGRDLRQPVEKILSLIDRAAELGYGDFTLTGGEPLLRHKDIVRILKYLGNTRARTPDITIVSNASILPQTLVNAACDYPGNIKFNISLHSIDPDKFKEIIRVGTDIEVVLGNIRSLVKAGIKVKLNSVVLNGLNSGSKNIEAFLDRARELGVSGVKFLELLVTPSNHLHYKYFYSDEAIWRDLRELEFVEQHTTLRTRLLRSPRYPDLYAEITRCTCKLGCANCFEHRDSQFDSLLRVHPCFVLSEKSIDPGEDLAGLDAALKQVRSSIDRYAEHYGNDSPVLVPHEVYVQNSENMFFSSEKTWTECDQIMKQLGYKSRKKRSFHLIFCMPTLADKDWKECNKVMKYGYDIHTPNKFEIIFTSEERFHVDGHLLSRSSYMSERPIEIPAHDMEHAQEYVQAFGYKTWFEKTFHINDYIKQEGAPIISIDQSTDPVNIKLNAGSLSREDMAIIVRTLDAKPILIPFPQWLYEHA